MDGIRSRLRRPIGSSAMSQAHGVPEASEVCVDCNNPNQSSAVAKPDSGKAATQENPLDAATFVPPIPHPYPSIIIEFCDRVRAIDLLWILRTISNEFLVSVVSLIITISDIVF